MDLHTESCEPLTVTVLTALVILHHTLQKYGALLGVDRRYLLVFYTELRAWMKNRKLIHAFS